jgi:23S rRNA (uracil1939-C5)-methyltransferase
LGRLDDGRVALVTGALPGERVVADITRARRDLAHATTIDVVDASPDRVTPPCPYVAAGCGGCDWQHVAVDTQAELKRSIVRDALARIAHIRDAPVAPTIALAPIGYRTTLRALVTAGGRLALREHASHDPVTIDTCLVAHAAIAELLPALRVPGAREVTVRVGARTGERMLVVDGPPAAASGLPDDVIVTSVREANRHHVHELVDATRLRISGRSFFQPHADAPSALAALVRDALGTTPVETLLDLYCGVGLFGALVPAARVIGIESNRAATADARHNLPNADIRTASIGRGRLPAADAIVADPPRTGLGPDVIRAIGRTNARAVALVSCDVAAAARDIAALHREGFVLTVVTPVDQFPHTSHVEIVSAFTR